MNELNIKDTKLIHMLIYDLELEGGSCLAELLISFNSTLRSYLGDRKLIIFLKGKINAE